MKNSIGYFFRHFLVVSLSFVFMLGGISTMVFAADGDSYVTDVSYYAYSWDEDEGQLIRETRNTSNEEWVSFPSQPEDNTVPAGKYVVQNNITINGRVILEGDTDIILTYNKNLNVKGLYIPKDCTLTIYETTENAGKWYAANLSSKPSAGSGIGGYSMHDNGNIVIHGGNIEAVGYDHCAGIGSNDGMTGGDITIYNGNIVATGGSQGAGIGGGRYCDGGNITIYQGDITANGGKNGAGIGSGQNNEGGKITAGCITIYDAKINATAGEKGAGIGGGDGGQAGQITIHGGEITASTKNKGTGIGSGSGGTTGDVTINGGKITATGGSGGSGIGGGYRGHCSTITINDGDITATGGDNGSGIGGGMESPGGNGTVIINGGTVNATGQYNAAGIGGSETESITYMWDYTEVVINGGKVTATGNECGAGIGGGREGTANVTINDGDVTATAGPYGTGIGSGPDGWGSSITIMGGKVNASSPSKQGCGIGNIQHGDSHITLGYTSDSWKTISITASSYSNNITLVNRFEASYGNYQFDTGIYKGTSDVAKTMAGKTLTAALDYAVWVEPSKHGKITLSSWEVPVGGKVKLTAKGDPGYIEDEIKVIRNDTGESIELSDDYTFVMPASFVTVSATFTNQREVQYLGLDGQMHTVTAGIVTDDLTSWEANKWYAVPRNTTINDLVTVKGKDVNLILCDGTTLNTKGGIDVDGHSWEYSDALSYDASLTIWAQSDAQTNWNTGKLVSAGIGGYSGYKNVSMNYSSGPITINGGNITAKGDDFSAAIGGASCNHNAGSVTINAGIVDATAGYGGVGIGNGRWSRDGKVTINGGTVIARSGEDGLYGIGGIDSKRPNVTIHLTGLHDSVTSSSYHQCNLTLVGNYIDQKGKKHSAGTTEFTEENGLANLTLRLAQEDTLNKIRLEPITNGSANILVNGVEYTQGEMRAYPGDIISLIATPKGSRSPKASFYYDTFGIPDPFLVVNSLDFDLQDGKLVYQYKMRYNNIKIKVEFTEAGGDPGDEGDKSNTDKKDANVTPLGPGASLEAADKAITQMKGDNDPEGSQYLPLKLKSQKQTKTSATISWTKPSNAVQYVIYGNRSGKTYSWKKLATASTTKKTFKKIAGKKVKKGTPYKFIVVALDKDNKVVSTSKVIHVYTKGGKNTNHKAVKIQVKSGKKYKTVKSTTVKVGKTKKIHGVGVKADKKLTYKTYLKIRYASSNNAVATVSSKGTIKGVKKGTCKIYAYSQNGVAKKIKLTVK